jgi:mannose-6-phosphate isomerase
MIPHFQQLIQFHPIYQTRVWGGHKLKNLFQRELPTLKPIGESWEIVDRKESQSITLKGHITLNEYWNLYRREVFGEKALAYEDKHFPLLLKLLSAEEDLSIQVHPPASIAEKLGGEPKTEAWYILHADPGAKVYIGLKDEITLVELKECIHQNKILDVIQILEVKAGDFYFLPSGRVHALGKGITLVEIQQNSDTTYRLYDWGRLGLDGKLRELHIEKGFKSIVLEDKHELKIDLAKDKHFKCDCFEVCFCEEKKYLGIQGEGVIMTVVEGCLELISGHKLSVGQVALVPASMPNELRLVSESSQQAKWLEFKLSDFK